uniref:Uncharacterized protein n=1 Tax=Lactuca sativa TaxID=4236 RepID=A0A9R1WLK3_LACSA|nr:hypothetical protein LSAT_V11C100034860 [Lactuca sativa]
MEYKRSSARYKQEENEDVSLGKHIEQAQMAIANGGDWQKEVYQKDGAYEIASLQVNDDKWKLVSSMRCEHKVIGLYLILHLKGILVILHKHFNMYDLFNCYTQLLSHWYYMYFQLRIL